MIIKLAIIILSSFSAVSWSIGIANDSKVSQVRVDKSGKGIVTFDKALVATPPACGSEYKYSLAFDTNTAGGRSIYSMVLAAKMANTTIYAKGTGICDIYSGVIESWSFGSIRD